MCYSEVLDCPTITAKGHFVIGSSYQYFDQRSRSALIHLSLLVMNRGVLLPHACMSPPRNIGAYVTSHDLKTGEFFALSQLRADIDIGVRGSDIP